KFRYVKGLANAKTHLVASFWGSDIYRKSRKDILKLSKHLGKCSVITLSGERMIRTFNEVFGNRFDRKIQPVFFGTSALDAIEDAKENLSKIGCKELLGIDPKTLTVT